jgi:hypothetical protein
VATPFAWLVCYSCRATLFGAHMHRADATLPSAPSKGYSFSIAECSILTHAEPAGRWQPLPGRLHTNLTPPLPSPPLPSTLPSRHILTHSLAQGLLGGDSPSLAVYTTSIVGSISTLPFAEHAAFWAYR